MPVSLLQGLHGGPEPAPPQSRGSPEPAGEGGCQLSSWCWDCAGPTPHNHTVSSPHRPSPSLSLLGGNQRKAHPSQGPWDPSELRLCPDGLPWSAGQCRPMQGEGLPDWGFGTESLHSPVPRKGLSRQGPRSPGGLPPERGVVPVCAPLFVSHCTSDMGTVIHARECASTATHLLRAGGPPWGA